MEGAVEQLVKTYIKRWNQVGGMNQIEIIEGTCENSFNSTSYYVWINYQGLSIFRQEVDLKEVDEEQAKIYLYGRFLETTFLLGVGARFTSVAGLHRDEESLLNTNNLN